MDLRARLDAAEAQALENERLGGWHDLVREQLSTETGRRFFYSLVFLRCRLDATTATNNGSEIFRHEGRRQVAAELVAIAQHAVPSLYVQMLQEQIAERAERATKNAKTTGVVNERKA